MFTVPTLLQSRRNSWHGAMVRHAWVRIDAGGCYFNPSRLVPSPENQQGVCQLMNLKEKAIAEIKELARARGEELDDEGAMRFLNRVIEIFEKQIINGEVEKPVGILKIVNQQVIVGLFNAKSQKDIRATCRASRGA